MADELDLEEMFPEVEENPERRDGYKVNGVVPYYLTMGPPDGCTKHNFQMIIDACYVSYMNEGETGLGFERIRHYLANYLNRGFTDDQVQLVLQSKEFKWALEQRGINYYNLQILSSRQTYALMIVFSNSTASFQNKLKKAGVTNTEWNSWMRQAAFYNQYRKLGEDALKFSVPEALNQLGNKAKSGDLSSIKFALEVAGRHDSNSKNQVDINQVMMQILDILESEIHDEETLDRIAKRLSGLSRRAELEQ